jgi:hypothetical protein
MEMGLYRPQRGKGLRQTPKAGNAAAHGWSVQARPMHWVWSLPALQKYGHKKNCLHFGNEMLYY